MSVRDLDKTYIAADVYRRWKRRVSDAEHRIVVFTPFLDRLLVALLGSAKITPDQIDIVTDLNPGSILEMPNQLRAIKSAMTGGMAVFSLTGLHAKVLLTDGKYVTVGSQNFTSHGRRSKECTAVPVPSLEKTRFVETLGHWHNSAAPLDEGFIDLLLYKLGKRIRQHRKLLADATQDFDRLVSEHDQEQAEAAVRKLRDLERQSRIQLSQGTAYGSIRRMHGTWDDYDSLVPDPAYDFTEWVIKEEDGRSVPYRLGRLSMYPMILAENNRMGFARIGRIRITYIRDTLEWSNKKLNIGDWELSVEIRFPATETKKRNIVVILKHPDHGSCKAAFLFTGDVASLVSRRYIRGQLTWGKHHDALVEALETKFFGSRQALDRFFADFFGPFTYVTLGRDNKNVRKYLTGSRYRLSVIQYQGNPILVVTRTS